MRLNLWWSSLTLRDPFLKTVLRHQERVMAGLSLSHLRRIWWAPCGQTTRQSTIY